MYVCVCVKGDVTLIFFFCSWCHFCVSRKVTFRITYFFGYSFGYPIFNEKFVQGSEYKYVLNSGLLVQLTGIDEQ